MILCCSSLCEITNSNAPESGEDCFKVLPLADGSSQYNVVANESEVKVALRLPGGKTCEQCVLRWQYTAGKCFVIIKMSGSWFVFRKQLG
jgi:hypothetical protein